MAFTSISSDAERDTPASASQKGVAFLGVRQDTDTIAEANGDLALVRLNDEGRLKVASKPAILDVVSGTLGAVNAAVTVDVTRSSNVVFHVRNTGTATDTASRYVFEGSLDSTDGIDGTWFGIQAVRSNSNTIETGVTASLALAAATGLSYSWEASVNAYNWARVRMTTAQTASATMLWRIQRGTYATEPIPAVQTHAVTASGTFPISLPTGSLHSFVTTASTNLTSVKNTPGNLFEISIFNTSGSTVFVKIYNKTSAPVVASDVPMLTIPVAAGTYQAVSFGNLGKRFAGYALAVTGGAAATDSTNVAAGVQISSTYV